MLALLAGTSLPFAGHGAGHGAEPRAGSSPHSWWRCGAELQAQGCTGIPGMCSAWWLQYLPSPCFSPKPKHSQQQNSILCASGHAGLSQEIAYCARWQRRALSSPCLLWLPPLCPCTRTAQWAEERVLPIGTTSGLGLRVPGCPWPTKLKLWVACCAPLLVTSCPTGPGCPRPGTPGGALPVCDLRPPCPLHMPPFSAMELGCLPAACPHVTAWPWLPPRANSPDVPAVPEGPGTSGHPSAAPFRCSSLAFGVLFTDRLKLLSLSCPCLHIPPHDVPLFLVGVLVGAVAVPGIPQRHISGCCKNPELRRECCTAASTIASPITRSTGKPDVLRSSRAAPCLG